MHVSKAESCNGRQASWLIWGVEVDIQEPSSVARIVEDALDVGAPAQFDCNRGSV